MHLLLLVVLLLALVCLLVHIKMLPAAPAAAATGVREYECLQMLLLFSCCPPCC
jgi:hypothetical protein